MNGRKQYRYLLPVLLLSLLPSLAQAQYTPIYTFNQNAEGCCANQPAMLAQGTDGNLYGTLPSGGTYVAGSWLEYDMSGLPILRNFGDTNTGLSNSNSGFTLGIDGYLYGGVDHVNGADLGAIFRLSSPSGPPSLVYQFTGGSNGTFPAAPPVQGTDLNLYGVTSDYGNSGYVYQVLLNTSTGTGTLGWILQLPSQSSAPLLLGSDGNFYGTYSNGTFSTTSKGAVVPSPNGYGGIFQITPAGAIGWYYNLNPFSTNNNLNGDGSNPQGAVMQAADGYLYGTASGGGTNVTAGGVIFKIAINGTGYSVVYNFKSTDGTAPHGGLLQGSDGYLYGLTTQNGPTAPKIKGFPPLTMSGTLFKVSTAGANPTVLVPFFSVPSLGYIGPGTDPESTPTLHTNGIIYGLTHTGGETTNGATGSQPGAFDDAGEFFSYNAALSPFISIVGQRSAHVGDQVGIIGQGFLNATGVTFGGTAASWTKFKVIIWNDHYMTVTVPAGAKTGLVTVLEPTGNLSTLYNFAISCSILCPPLLPLH
jgi:hypothetical protein